MRHAQRQDVHAKKNYAINILWLLVCIVAFSSNFRIFAQPQSPWATGAGHTYLY